jgi:hypothetical protein
MPRYFFNIEDGKNIDDVDGSVLSDDGDAREQAITTAAEIIRSEAATLRENEVWSMRVTDETGRCVVTLRFSTDDHTQQTNAMG